ncbi:MAG: hypothetical protein Q9175_001850 [Cornicularia normoerica]
MSENNCPNIAGWLSDVPEASQDSETPVTPTKFTQQRKRLLDHFDLPQKHLCHHHLLTSKALAELSPNMFNTPSSSGSKQRSKKLNPAVSPQTDASKPSYEAASRPITTSPSSSGTRQTNNEDSIRTASAEQGMFFEDEVSYKRYPELQATLDQTVFGERGSAIRDESLKKIDESALAHITRCNEVSVDICSVDTASNVSKENCMLSPTRVEISLILHLTL